MPVELFFCYAPEDEPWRHELVRHLALMERQRYLNGWSGSATGGSKEWREETKHRMAQAQVILLLISADFLASNEIYDGEVKWALQLREQGTQVFGVLLRPCGWERGELREIEMLPRAEGRVTAITEFGLPGTAFRSVVMTLRENLRRLMAGRRFINPLGDSPPTDSAVRALPEVWNVPYARNLTFTGRVEEFERLRQRFDKRRFPRTAVQVIHGLSGVGKTALAMAYAYRFGADYDVVWWLRADEPARLAVDFDDLADDLEHHLAMEQLGGSRQSGQRETVRKWLGGNKRWLLVFDGAHEPDDVKPYLPRDLLGDVLVTSQNSAWSSMALLLPLEPLKLGEGVEFLVQRGIGEREEAAAREDLVAELGALPLALVQAGDYIEESGISIGEYLRRYRQLRGELMRRGIGRTDLTAIFLEAVAGSLAARELFASPTSQLRGKDLAPGLDLLQEEVDILRAPIPPAAPPPSVPLRQRTLGAIIAVEYYATLRRLDTAPRTLLITLALPAGTLAGFFLLTDPRPLRLAAFALTLLLAAAFALTSRPIARKSTLPARPPDAP